MLCRISILVFAISSLLGSTFAATITWDGSTNRVWDEPSNWDLSRLPTSNDTAILPIAPGPIIDSGVAGAVNTIQIGSPTGGTLDVNGGTLATSGSNARIDLGYDAGTNGTLTINSGTVTCASHMYLGYNGTGTLIMNGGTLNIAGTRFRIGYNSSGVGRIYLYGGTINCDNTSTDFAMAHSGTASMDITNGQLVINRNLASAMNDYVNYGLITAYGGMGTVLVDYGITNPGKTTVKGTFVRTAKNPAPASSATNVAFNKILAWKPGAGAMSHDVYFGTSLADVNSTVRLLCDLNGDSVVDWMDVSLLTDYWLTNPAGSEPYAGINDDSIVDFIDYAQFAQDWMKNTGAAFKGNYDVNSFSPGALALSTTYYWRIDEVNGPNTYRGTVWSFTTESGKASGPNPINTATNVGLNPTLTWTASPSADSHNVYFGTTTLPAFQANQTAAAFSPGTLAYSTTYYWRIDEVSVLGTIEGDVWSFTTAAAPPPPGQAANPTPGNNATGIAINATLSWTAGSGATSHDVYFGTTNPPAFQNNQAAATFNPGTLAYSTTYYWRIDEKNANGTTTGNIWTFTTAAAPPPPGQAANPTPANNATGIAINAVLSWTAGSGAISHDVYFGTTNPPVFQNNQTTATFSPGILGNNTTYYWRIDENNATGTTTGDVWTFTTADVSSDDTLVGKIMCGYQGWFACPGDGSGRSWAHWANGAPFDYTNLKIEMWPDMNEYSRKYLTGFTLGNPPYYVFSSYDANTTQVHFRWMQEYGIDGVFVQRFGSDFGVKNFLNTILTHCKQAANAYGRKYAVMYDLTGYTTSSLVNNIETDWLDLENNLGITTDPLDNSYIIHNGKPVIAIYGIFGTKVSNYPDPALCATLIQWFKDRGFTVLIGVNNDWRTRTSDTNFQLCVSRADIIMPWNVGRYATTQDVISKADGLWTDDLNWCNQNGKEYLICVFPGFSWHNWNGGTFDQIPRRGGQFLWEQYYNAQRIGATMIYQAMFDEVDESSAIFKVTNDPPPPSGNIQFLTLQGLPSDEYLWLCGQGTRMLRGEIPLTSTRPAR
jgi:hypothetical protein